MRRKKWPLAIVGFTLFALVFVAVFGSAVDLLWNALMPQLFGLPHIGFGQAVGLLTLSWLLFGGWRGMPRHSRPWRGRHHERCPGLTEEERIRLERGIRSCRARTAPPAEEPQPGGS